MNPCGSLTARFGRDPDGTGELSVRAESQGYSGHGAAYFGEDELVAFARKLEDFPMHGTATIAGGFWKEDNSNQLKQELLALSVAQANSQGYLSFVVRMATPLLSQSRERSLQCVQLEIITTYEHIKGFAKAFAELARGTREEVGLGPERT
jgi:hypothetical protein